MRGVVGLLLRPEVAGVSRYSQGDKKTGPASKNGRPIRATRSYSNLRLRSVAFILESQPIGLAKPVQHRLEGREYRDGESDDRPK
jgi:hypothetical protein